MEPFSKFVLLSDHLFHLSTSYIFCSCREITLLSSSIFLTYIAFSNIYFLFNRETHSANFFPFIAVYNMSVVCIAAIVLMFATIIALAVLPRNTSRDIVLMVLFVVFWVFSWIIEEVIMRCMLAKMVPSCTQSFVETLRNGASRVSTIVASITAPMAMHCLQWWSAGLVVIVVVLLTGFLVRRRQLCNIEQIDQFNYGNTELGGTRNNDSRQNGNVLEGTEVLEDTCCNGQINEAFA